jgi:hypothetical protein
MHLVFLVGVSLLGSKVWMTFNPDVSWSLIQMNVGPWMSHGSYIVHAAVTAFVGYILYTFTIPERLPVTE